MKAPGFWYRPPGIARVLLAPAGWVYGAAGQWRMARARPLHAGIPVLCVGNLVAGGTGKTPVALALAAWFAEQGVAAHFLTRGYGGRKPGPLRVEPDRHDAAAVGDEALLLAAAAPTWVARRRADGAAAASAAGAPLLVMDDGFQHPGLARDLALLVVDGATGFGNGAVIPAGPLREPIERGLARADAVIVIGEDRCGVAERLARRVGPPVPLLRARLVPDPAAAAALRGKRVLAFAGIGRPEKFFQTCREVGAEIVEQVALPDHHAFRTGEIATLTARAATLGAIPVTTSKDAARLPPALRAAVPVLPVAVAWERPADLEPLLGRLLTRPRPGTADG